MDVSVAVTAASDSGGSLDTAKVVLEAIQAAVTTIAIIVAGIWTYLLFVRQRQRFPRAELAHKVSCVPVADRRVLVHVAVVVKNIGAVLVRLSHGHAQIQQLRPLPSEIADAVAAEKDPVDEGCTEALWPLLGRRDCMWEADPHEIEPGESDEFHFDFLVPIEVQTIETYSYFRNTVRHDREIGWNHTTLCELSTCRIDTIQPKGGDEDGQNHRRQ